MDFSTLKLDVNVSNISMHNETFLKHSQQFYESRNKEFTNLNCQFIGGQSLVVSNQTSCSLNNNHSSLKFFVKAQASICVSKSLRWWDKTLKPNMIDIHSAQQFVDTLNYAQDRLVIVDFYSPACGGCKSLHPKICQLAESNPNAIFLKVNYEELKPMCDALHIHVLPFFRFYRGSEGRVSSFSCTISTIKKFKDALKKHSTERCSLGAAKGLDESELFKLASIGELSMKPSSIKEGTPLEDFDLGSICISNTSKMSDYNAMLVA